MSRFTLFLLAGAFMMATGGEARAQKDVPAADPPRLFAVPAKPYSAFGRTANDSLHQMQYREVKEHLFRSFYDYERVEKTIPDGNYSSRLDTEDQRDEAIHKLIAGLKDRFTVYQSPSELSDQYWRFMNGQVSLGVTIDRDCAGNYFVSFVRGASPAYYAGLRRGDQIVSIDGVELKGMSQADADLLLMVYTGEVKVVYKSGEKNAANNAGENAAGGAVQPSDANVELSVTVDAPAIQIVSSRVLAEGLWYIHVQHFSSDRVLIEFAEQVQALNRTAGDQRPRGIILDLRGNQGGYMNIAYQFASTFIKEGKIGELLQRSGRVSMRTSYDAKPIFPPLLARTEENHRLVATLQEAPLVVLVDGSTISAGEMLTSALEANKRGVVIGTTTWGKGVSFHTLNLSSGGTLQICTGVFTGPDGFDHRDKGVEPNIVVAQPRGWDEDRQLEAAVEYLNTRKPKQDTPVAKTDSPAHGKVILIGLTLVMVLLAVLALRGRRLERAAIRRRNQRLDADFETWLLELADASCRACLNQDGPAEEVIGREPVLLVRDHFMVGARCHDCQQRFEAGETVVEVFTTSGQYVCCRDCGGETSSEV